MKITFCLCLILLSLHLTAEENYDWWYAKHHLDKNVEWGKYIRAVPGLMGPNALPVPDVKDAQLNDKMFVDVATQYHFSNHETAWNPYGLASFPVAPGRVAFQFFSTPFEYWNTDTIIRDQRFARTQNPKGSSKGDCYLSTLIQLLKNTKHWPDILLCITTKTTTGKNIRNARNTDAPGYYFSLNLGKRYYFEGSTIKQWGWTFMGGTYIWQDYFDSQNDAVLSGLSGDCTIDKINLRVEIGSYIGWRRYYDQAVVARFKSSYKMKYMDIYIQYQQGLRDFIRSSVKAGFIWDIGSIKSIQNIVNRAKVYD